MENNQRFSVGGSGNGNQNFITSFDSTNLTNPMNGSNSSYQLSNLNVSYFNSHHHYNTLHHLHQHSSNTLTNPSQSNNEPITHEYNDQLESMSNLIINNPQDSFDPDTALLDKYEYDVDNMLNENYLQSEKEHRTQRLFQSFQTSACAVAQLFKEKSINHELTSQSQQLQNPNTSTNKSNQWQLFQNAASSITVLYKDSLEVCKTHYDLGVSVGQQRKVKDIFGWLKKKKRRTIRKDELIQFLISTLRQQQQTQSPISDPLTNNCINFNASNPTINSAACILKSSRQISAPVHLTNINQTAGTPGSSTLLADIQTSSDLATFREALINRQRDNHTNSSSSTNLLNHHFLANHHNSNSNHHHQHLNCDDLDCFFCDQLAKHVENKRTSSTAAFESIESPSRKRSRFY